MLGVFEKIPFLPCDILTIIDNYILNRNEFCFLVNGGIVCIIGKQRHEKRLLLHFLSELQSNEELEKYNILNDDILYDCNRQHRCVFASNMSRKMMKNLECAIVTSNSKKTKLYIGIEDMSLLNMITFKNITYFIFLTPIGYSDVQYVSNYFDLQQDIPQTSFMIDVNKNEIILVPEIASALSFEIEIKNSLLHNLIYSRIIINIIISFSRPNFIVR
jgi:hypothetical protein